MKKQSIFVAITLALVALTAATASAEMWDDYVAPDNKFVDRIEYWTPCRQPAGETWELGEIDSVLLTENLPLTYTHTIDGFVPGEDLVTEAYLNLDFTNADGLFGGEGDDFDLDGWWIFDPWDHREFVRFAYDGSAWVELGEDDGGQYNYDLYMDLGVLNTDGSLIVTVGVWNELGTGDVWLDHSVLYGNVVPVPGAVLLGMLGLGAAGVRLRKFA